MYHHKYQHVEHQKVLRGHRQQERRVFGRVRSACIWSTLLGLTRCLGLLGKWARAEAENGSLYYFGRENWPAAGCQAILPLIIIIIAPSWLPCASRMMEAARERQ